MHYYSWSFVCVAFHVVAWLLSSIVRITSFMPMFRVLWSQLAMLHIDLIKIVLVACHLKNYYFCYHLPTRGRAGVKLGDACYVANISIIFDAPCLFYINCFMFCLHFVAFLCIFCNQPINKMPQCQFLFSAIFVFQKSYTGNILKIRQNKAWSSYFLSRYRVQSRDRGGPRAGHTIG
jgi:hypothetical protein